MFVVNAVCYSSVEVILQVPTGCFQVKDEVGAGMQMLHSLKLPPGERRNEAVSVVTHAQNLQPQKLAIMLKLFCLAITHMYIFQNNAQHNPRKPTRQHPSCINQVSFENKEIGQGKLYMRNI